jgi:hypothetical protein
MRRSILVINFEDKIINPRICDNTRASIMDACDRWGCDFIEIGHHNWKLTLAPAATKTEIFSGIEGDEVLILDSDLIISSTAPNPFEEFPKDCMTVIANATPRHPQYTTVKQIELQEWTLVEAEFGPAPYVPADYFNTGVMMVRKELHAEVMKMALEMHKVCCQKNIGLNWVDQTLINYATKKLRVKMNVVDDSWNYVFPTDLGPDWLNMKKYIYHLAGIPARNELLPLIHWK